MEKRRQLIELLASDDNQVAINAVGGPAAVGAAAGPRRS